jgi:hypothetical protein
MSRVYGGTVSGSWPLGYWDREFESRSWHGCLSSSFCAVLSCVGRGLAAGPVQGVLPSVKNHDFETSRRGGLGSPRNVQP